MVDKLVITHTGRSGTWRPYLEHSSDDQVRVYIPKGWKVVHDHSAEKIS